MRRGEDRLDLGGPKLGIVLAALLLRRNEPVSVDELAEALWGEEAPDSAPATVQVYISRLRRALGERADGQPVILTRRPGYLIRVDPGQLDVDEFESLAAEAAAAMSDQAPAIAAANLRRALDLWRGEPLADFRYEPFAEGPIRRLEEMRLVAIEDRIDADLALARHAEVVPELVELTRLHPYRERMRAQLMLALYRCGRQSEGLEAYHDTAETLDRDIGVEPGPELRELQRRILHQDPTLEVEAPAAPEDGGELGVLPLIGRREHLLALEDAARLAERGRKVVVDVEGAAGSGKSRLIEEFLSRLDPDRFDIRQTAAFKATGAAPGELIGHLAIDSEAERSLEAGTLVVAVDDAQWADPASLRRLRDLITAGERRALLLFAHRPAKGLADIVFQTIWDSAASEGSLVRLPVGPLSVPDLARVLKAAEPLRLAERMVETTGGLPFHVEELAGFWIETGGMVRDGDRMNVVGEMDQWAGPAYSPANLATLRAEDLRLLHAVSIAGAPISAEESAHLLGASRDRAMGSFERLSRAGLVLLRPEGVLPIHDLAAVAIAEGMGPVRRAEVYAGLARMRLERATTDGDREQAGWYLLDAGEHQQAAPLLEEGALRHIAQAAPTEALPLLDGAILARTRSGAEPEEIARLKTHRAAATMSLNAPPSAVAADLEDALPHLSGAELADAALTIALVADDRWETTRAGVIAAAGAADAMRLGRFETAGVLYSWLASIMARLGFVAEADEACRKCEGLLAEHGSPGQLHFAPWAWAMVAFVRGDAVRADGWYRAGYDQLEGLGDDWVVHVIPWWALTIHWRGRVRDALAREEQFRLLAHKTHVAAALAIMDEHRSLGMSLLGRFEDALESGERSLDRFPLFSPLGEPRARHALARALLGLGRVNEAHDEVRNALDLLPRGPDAWFLRGDLRVTELAIRSRVEGRWAKDEAEALSKELLGARRLQLASELLSQRAEEERRPDLAQLGVEIALDVGIPMLAARAADAGGLWGEPLGALVRSRLEEMHDQVPSPWRRDWMQLPHVAPTFL